MFVDLNGIQSTEVGLIYLLYQNTIDSVFPKMFFNWVLKSTDYAENYFLYFIC